MNAHKFVIEHGIERARDVVELAPQGATHLSKDTGHYVNANFEPMPAHIKEQLPSLIVIAELKQVVESLDTIDRLFGLDQAKHTMKIAKEIGYTSDYEQIKQAIADYELVESYKQVKVEVSFGIALQNNQSVGAKCEVLDMVDVSPNCEVRNG
ncbi:hypothetical protein QR556_07020 [Acinetobacter soli]|uniref:hypothetical protein n=1 Tax=Acinetobacter soli TaxID=487316 RepID=UPI002D7E94CF|nr:hypothetical protein [Acinetobacter soli]MEB4800713.1 hypothetical protein [Acinetobacter soli]